MKQYFIGIEKRSEKMVLGLLDLGATLMFKHHYKTIELNEKFMVCDEWFLYTDVYPNSGIEEIESFLRNNLGPLEYMILEHKLTIS